MYKNFFGFKERPFQLVPNPAYLFLSKSHEEALAHLSYALSQGDGFVEITGEVGTGKTTLCRVFLEQLGKGAEAAYIFNPRLDAVQLLKAINDEFGISSGADTVKELIDTLNRFLIEKKAEGKPIILLIDEAQNLSKGVLEQLRLLSNLETTTSKLLQIILVGQPELHEILDAPELRQLAQRITLSCHITPLNRKETREYIEHRLRVASQKPGLNFTGPAMDAIYRYAQGIPRRINIACDRTLLTAYGLGQRKIGAKIARTAIAELSARRESRRYRGYARSKTPTLLAVYGLCLLVLLGGMVYLFQTRQGGTAGESRSKAAAPIASSQPPSSASETPSTSPASEPPPPTEPPPAESGQTREATAPQAAQPSPLAEPPAPQASAKPPAKEPPEKPAITLLQVGLGDYLKSRLPERSRRLALEAVLERWRPEAEVAGYPGPETDAPTFFRLMARQNGLELYPIEEALDLIRRLNLPAILAFYPDARSDPVYLALDRIDGDRFWLLGAKDEGVVAGLQAVEYYWSGRAYLLWKNFYGIQGTLPRDRTRESMLNLKILLKKLGFDDILMSADYDPATRQAVRSVQKRYQVTVDGLVGPVTKIILYNELNDRPIPRLRD